MTTSGATQLFTPSPAIEPDDITVGPNGNLWFSSGLYGRIGEITPTGTATEFQLPIGSGGGITTGPDGNVWFTGYSDVIGEMTPGGILTLYQTPTEQSDPSDIVAGPDGNLWFTEYDADQIGRITPGGTVTEYRIPTPDAGPVGIAEGPNGNLWFTESRADQIGEIVFAQPSITSASSASVTAGHALGFTVTTTAFPPPALSEIGNLPNGVQFTDNGDGTATLSGTPSSSAAGTYTFTIDAGNMIGSDATQTFTLTVTAPPATVTMSTASTTSPTSTVSSTPVKPVAAAPVLPACASDPTDVHGRALGGLELGMSRAAAARAYPRSKERGPDSQEFFCVGTNGLTADFASNRLLRTLDRAWRARLSGRIALISTTSPEYSVDGLHVRDFLAEAAARLPLGLPLRLGGAAWYLVPVGDVTLVLKVRDRTVEELGIADRQLTATPAGRRAFLASFA